MSRLPRIKGSEDKSWYHICARVAGGVAWYPFDNPLIREKFLSLVRRYLEVFCCEAAAFCLMGNHYHLVLCFESFKWLSREELYQRARKLYRDPDSVLLTEEHWKRFNQRIFDLSELMRVIQSRFARWYNKTHNRRGSFWAERFKSVLLEKGESVLDAVLYVELNPVRAGLAERPEDWKWSSAFLRDSKSDAWMLPLPAFVAPAAGSSVELTYRSLLYYRGAIKPGKGGKAIPEEILKMEAERGFLSSGAFRKRIAYLTEGAVLGSEIMVCDWISRFRRKLYYRRRKNPIIHKLNGAVFYSLKEQRLQIHPQPSGF